MARPVSPRPESLFMTFLDILLAELRKKAYSERDKGGRFERLMRAYLLTDPLYAGEGSVFNLRGNQRTGGEFFRREGGRIFGSGSRSPIAITILVKKPKGAK